MKKISRTSVSTENIYMSDSGCSFPYEGLAIEDDIRYLYDKIAPLKVTDINLSKINLVGEIFRADTKEELRSIEEYCELLGFEFEYEELPVIIIIGETFAITLDELNSAVNW